MRTILTGLLAICLTFTTNAQLQNGGIHAGFVVDGDTKVGYSKFGPFTVSAFNFDDWFLPLSYSGSGIPIFDTIGASSYMASLQAKRNISFTKRMSQPMYTVVNNKLWLDAIYSRDYSLNYTSGVITGPDSTAFTNSAKNVLNPNSNWQGGSFSFTNKTDLVDGFTHMRRDGTSIYDSLWMFFGVSTLGTNGDRYYDIELFKKQCTYNPISGAFSTSGTDGGHTAWKFDASGRVTQTGDMIIAVNYSPGSAPAIDMRIWVSSSTYSSVTPYYFNFDGVYDGSGGFGYAKIVSKSGGTAWGSGVANYNNNLSTDTTYSTPWGTSSMISGNNAWRQNYEQLQFVEIGLNLSRIGVDAALYSAQGINPCESAFYSVLFKSRSSSSFTANLQDFLGPLDFKTATITNYSTAKKPLTCINNGEINITNLVGSAIYKWSTNNGLISGSNADSTSLQIAKEGTYYLQMSPYSGCPALRSDTIVVSKDSFQPVASINFTAPPDVSYIQLYGGSASASNYSTPFGGSQGLNWEWSGPNSYSATTQNPVVTPGTLGTYQLIVTEKRNGCKDTMTALIDMITLDKKDIALSGQIVNNKVRLNWQNSSAYTNGTYTVEKSSNGSQFSVIGTIIVNGNQKKYSFNDNNVSNGNQYYRIKMNTAGQKTVYSNTVKFDNKALNNNITILNRKSTSSIIVNGMQTGGIKITTVMYSLSGSQIAAKETKTNGNNFSVEVNYPSAIAPGIYIISTFIDNKLTDSKKLVL